MRWQLVTARHGSNRPGVMPRARVPNVEPRHAFCLVDSSRRRWLLPSVWSLDGSGAALRPLSLTLPDPLANEDGRSTRSGFNSILVCWFLGGALASIEARPCSGDGASNPPPLLLPPLPLAGSPLALELAVLALCTWIAWLVYSRRMDDNAMATDPSHHREDRMEVDESLAALLDPPSEQLLFPGEWVEGEFLGRQEDIGTAHCKKRRLVELCKDFKIPHTGNMALLRERLRAFSRCRDGWNQLNGNARNAHIGPRPGKPRKARPQKQSTQRSTQMLAHAGPSSTQQLPVILLTAVPEQRWNQAQHEEDMQWALNVISMYPYRREAPDATTAQEPPPAAQAMDTGRYSFAAGVSIKEGLTKVNKKLDQILQATSSIQLLTPPSPPYPELPPMGPSPPPPPIPSLPQAEPHAAPASSLPKARSITLANRVNVCFTDRDIPPPPATSFADDIPALNRMWDDITEHWDGFSYLIINKQPIAIVYWLQVYSSKSGNHKQGQWKGIKGKYSEWKFLVKRYRQGTPEDFWAEFTEDGKRLGYTAINNLLAQQRAASDQQLAQQAKDEYGDQFGDVFFYVKDRQRRVKTKACDIAKQYRQLRELDEA